MSNIILFDGDCNLCDHSVQFIIKRDPKANYRFASLQSDIGQKLLKEYKVPDTIDSIVLIENKQSYTQSTAALHVCKNLNGLWKFLFILLVIPRPIRDFFYNIIARNRYKWFGKRNSCLLPSPEIRKRFL